MKIKKQKAQKMCHKRKLKFGIFKNYLEATQLDNKIKYLEENINIDNLKKIIKNL